MKIQTLPENRGNHKKYLAVLHAIDTFLQNRDYQKVDVTALSPVLIPESYLEVFETEYRYFDQKEKLYLIPSSELFLKRLLAVGFGSCYTLMKNYRNSEAPSSRHLSEFTMLEMYKVDAGYFDVAEDVIELFKHIAETLYGKPSIIYQGKEVSLRNYEKITVREAFQKYAGITDVFSHEELFEEAAKKGYIVDGFSYSAVWSQVYAQEVEPNLGTNGKPTIIYDYPRELAAIVEFDAAKNAANRFEIYIHGIELGNCGNEVSENTDFDEMQKRLEKEYEERKNNDKIMFPPDTEFMGLLKKMPKTSGIAIGVDRLAMIFTDVESVSDLQVITLSSDSAAE